MAAIGSNADKGSGISALPTGKHLTFNLADEEYGISLLKVKEIIGMMPITPIPGAPAFIKGVINLRGKVIPIIDLRLKFEMNEKGYNERTCIIVVETDSELSSVQTGIVVDSVSEVLSFQKDDVEAAPDFGQKLTTDYIMGMARSESSVRILLDIDTILNASTIDALIN